MIMCEDCVNHISCLIQTCVDRVSCPGFGVYESDVQFA